MVKLINNKKQPAGEIPLIANYDAKSDIVIIRQFFFNMALPFLALEKIYEDAKLNRAKSGLLSNQSKGGRQ